MGTFSGDESVQAKMNRALEEARSRHPNALVQIVITGTARDVFMSAVGADAVCETDVASVLVGAAAKVVKDVDPQLAVRLSALEDDLIMREVLSPSVREAGQVTPEDLAVAAGPDWSGEPERMLRKRASADALGVTPPRDVEREG